MNVLENLDLLSVAFAVSATFVLGFTIYFSDRKSITNQTFFAFSIVTGVWGLSNFFGYRISDPNIALSLLRAVMALALLQAFTIFQLFYVFPKKDILFPKLYKYVIFPIVGITTFIAATPLVLSEITEISSLGRITKIANGPAIPLFGMVSIALVISALIIFIRHMMLSHKKERGAYAKILVGTALMFGLIITFNFVFPAILSNPKYVPLGALFTFPFVAFASFAILRHKLFSIKVISTSALVFLLSILLFLELLITSSWSLIVFRSSVFLLVLVFGINLIRGVIREVKQKEQLQSLTRQLEKANAKLKELDQLKTEFLSLASHQLRSPLTAIKGYTSMLLEGSFGKVEEQQKDAINRVYESTQHLTKVVEDLLNVSKIEQGGMKYEMAEFDLEKAAHDLATDLSVTAEKKGLKLTFETDNKSPYTLYGDMEKLRQVILNLIDNAIKYTQEGGITVKLTKEVGNFKLDITDTGMGISPEEKEKLFQKFSRGAGGKTNTGGSGLGLYLAKEIVAAHKGRVDITSPGVGKGSTFSIILPQSHA